MLYKGEISLRFDPPTRHSHRTRSLLLWVLPYFFYKFGMNIIGEFLEVKIQHSGCVHIPFPLIAYTHDVTTFAEKLETVIFNHSVKGAE